MSPLRITSLIVLSFLLAVGLAVRLFGIAVLQHGDYVQLAAVKQNVVKDILPKRGEIWAQNYATGSPTVLAESVERFALSATPANVKYKSQFAHLLSQITGKDEGELLRTFKANGEYMNPLKQGLDKAAVEDIIAKINALESSLNSGWTDQQVDFSDSQGQILNFVGGVFFVRQYARTYPEGGLLAQALGFVNSFGTGQYGFEEHYNDELEGYAGQISVERDSHGTPLKQTQSIEGKDGTSYELSIDRNVQFVAERELAAEVKDSEAEGGSVIIMDPKTGEIMAMANAPSYDPNNFRDITDKDITLFDNPSISKVWEPGSIFKPIVMSAAMDLGLVTPQTESTFPESVTVGGYKIETALRRAYGTEDMTKVLVNSDNVAMVWVSDKIGNQKMYDYLKKYGLGTFTGVDLENEVSGSVLPVAQWRDINRATMSFGQGIAVTPMQIVTAYATIAHDGRAVRPHIVHAVIHPDGSRETVAPVFGDQVIKPETAKTLRDMMVSVVVNSHAKAGTEGYKIAGKTGTAQIPDPVNGGYLPDAYNHSFIGIGPSDDPRYVMLVKIDHPNLQKVGLYAEGTAVPLFGRISSFLLNYYQIPPTNK